MLFIIDTANGAVYYKVFSLASIIIATGIVFYSGIKKGYPGITWLLIILTGGFLFMIGEKLATYSPNDWMAFFTGFRLPATSKRTVLGGIIGLIIGLILAKKWMRFQAPILDHYAIALPLLIAISRIGCLMAGCCFGTTTDLPWGIHYDFTTPAFQAHLLERHVQFDDNITAAVHPVQFYEMTGCLMIAFLTWKIKRILKISGSLFLFSVLCYAALRFLTEFVRDPHADLTLVQPILGLKTIQWVLMGIIIIGMMILMLREWKSEPYCEVMRSGRISVFRQVMLVVMIASLVILVRKWFTSGEFTVILSVVSLVNIIILGKISKWLIRIGFYRKINIQEPGRFLS